MRANLGSNPRMGMRFLGMSIEVKAYNCANASISGGGNNIVRKEESKGSRRVFGGQDEIYDLWFTA